jgi:hydrogenase maturation protein HypF
MALAYLLEAGEEFEWMAKCAGLTGISLLLQMIARRFHSPLTSSVGRLFDAAAALIGIRSHASFEGQAAIELEWRAMEGRRDDPYPFAIQEASPRADSSRTLIVDTVPLIRALVGDVKAQQPAADIARRFHFTLVEAVAAMCGRIREQTNLGRVVCSGGVFMNRLFTEAAASRLEEDGFTVYLQECVPANDGGLCLGQLAIAACCSGGESA